MAFTLPTFNLPVDIYTVSGGLKSLRLTVNANLALGRRTAFNQAAGEEDGELVGKNVTLLVPALTDVRDVSCGGEADVVDAPAGSGRWYIVTMVDDAGKGFLNEHRVVTLAKVWDFAGVGVDVPNWPTPIP